MIVKKKSLFWIKRYKYISMNGGESSKQTCCLIYTSCMEWLGASMWFPDKVDAMQCVFILRQFYWSDLYEILSFVKFIEFLSSEETCYTYDFKYFTNKIKYKNVSKLSDFYVSTLLSHSWSLIEWGYHSFSKNWESVSTSWTKLACSLFLFPLGCLPPPCEQLHGERVELATKWSMHAVLSDKQGNCFGSKLIFMNYKPAVLWFWLDEFARILMRSGIWLRSCFISL